MRGTLAKVGRQRNAGIHCMGIELAPLNTASIEVHRELAKVNMGAKHIAIKNKNVWKTVKLTQGTGAHCAMGKRHSYSATNSKPTPNGYTSKDL